MPKIDEAAYQEGLALFRDGKTVRDIAEQFPAEDAPPDEAGEARLFSRMLGFADGFLALVRGAK